MWGKTSSGWGLVEQAASIRKICCYFQIEYKKCHGDIRPSSKGDHLHTYNTEVAINIPIKWRQEILVIIQDENHTY